MCSVIDVKMCRRIGIGQGDHVSIAAPFNSVTQAMLGRAAVREDWAGERGTTQLTETSSKSMHAVPVHTVGF